MTTHANSALGETRVCPHCKSTILKSAAACPACQHFLRFEAVNKFVNKTLPPLQPLRIEGTLRQPFPGKPCEYTLMVVIHDDQGEEIARQAVAVGVLGASETRTFAVWVEVYSPENGSSGNSAD